MLQLKDIRKSYTTGGFTQVALDGVSINFRDNEFAAILGPSGSGKTTLLNIIGGLDHYDSGDLVIDGVSTKDYTDRDWDTFRNNRIGFVFQSYNLIPHQTVLANVELALTLSGVNREERRERAIAQLQRVGLGDHVNKKPSQLSGGQMQRVAIARALINDPEILLADEPTGALDSKTSIQIMDLLTEIANDRLVVMVTHNPELADEYATRIVNLSDGHILADTDPYSPSADEVARVSAKKPRRTSMSFLTALSLSFNNLMTKKGRTIMTAFAGSIGIIGIAAILSLANGVNNYIKNVEEETLAVYPLQVMDTGFDITSYVSSNMSIGDSGSNDDQSSATIEGDGEGILHETKMVTSMFDGVQSNDLRSLKEYLETPESGIDEYAKSIHYSYNVTPHIFDADTSEGVRQINPNLSFQAMGMGGESTGNSFSSMMMNVDVFGEMPGDMDTISENYDILAGHMPENYNECILALGSSGKIPDVFLYSLGLRDDQELDDMVHAFVSNDEIDAPMDEMDISYDDILNVRMKLVTAADFYQYDEGYGVWVDKREDDTYMKNLVDGAEEVRIVGILVAKPDANVMVLGNGVLYPSSMIEHIIEESGRTQIVKDQMAEPAIDVFNGKTFAEEAEDGSSSDFDMGNLFTVDEGALSAAFTFDESKLKLDLSGLNINFDAASLPQPNIDFSQMGDGESGDQTGSPDMSGMEVDQQVANQMVSQLMADFQRQLPSLPGTTMAEKVQSYMASDSAKAIIAKAMADGLIDMSAMQEQQQAQQATMQKYLNDYLTQYMGQLMEALSKQMRAAVTTAMTRAMNQLAANMSSAMSIDTEAFKNAFRFDMTEDELTELIMSMMSSTAATFDSNLAKLDYAELDNPSEIDIYARDFDSKQGVIDVLDRYNERMEAEGEDTKVITYTDIVGTMMSSVTTIIDMISYVLIAFVSISLIVSSIMIGVITYISVLERKKEIGILRAIGASKSNVSQIFNAETVIEGLISGALGVGITALGCIPASAIVYAMFDVPNVASLPWAAGLILILISVALSFIAGLIPASRASHADPVEALRSE